MYTMTGTMLQESKTFRPDSAMPVLYTNALEVGTL